jgi:DNA polymerase-1
VKAPDVITVDFETEAIRQRPHYPPKPVGVATKWPGHQSKYLSWGHPTNNNATLSAGMKELEAVWHSGLPVLFHHSKFDLAVACEGLGLPMLPWQRTHDTVYLAFLADPHARDLGLKEMCEDLLNWPPEERDRVRDWILEHADQLAQTYGERVLPSETGAWIAKAPGNIVEPYACGDTDRTSALYHHLWPIIQREGMGPAYDRERRLMPILMNNERVGMRVDMDGLERDVAASTKHMAIVERWLRKTLGVPDLNFDADRDVANSLLAAGIVPEENWTRTKPTKNHPLGQLSVAKDNLLPEHFTDPRVASALGYRNRLKTCQTMFMEPWLAQASENNGHITTNWNQTRGYEGGTRSGRPSTNKHNFLNLSKDFIGRDDGYVAPDFLVDQYGKPVLPALPLVRKYVLPDEGGIFLHRDFDGQEMRVFAHVECGTLQAAYFKDPTLDPHAFVGDELMRVVHREIERTKVKSLNFQGLYGGGVPALQRKLRCSYTEAKNLKQFHDKALPGRKIVVGAIKELVKRGEPIRTWGGRVYYCEPSRIIDGRMRSMDYKLINYYCQGSAADITKEAICQWHEAGAKARFLVTVYDEINISAHKDIAVREMKILKESMEVDRLVVKMISTPKHGASWGAAKTCKVDGKVDRSCPLCA